ncbi:putative toxin-antitoxin system toxin component, PIN family [Dyadobacter sp. CY107]|uniref:putative toxin-antitoxin system toxin component, PIN family n=1 Tax=Dyadobacter fanqingshengii TaxID=2906443 RepID=UPI001F212E9F|nr:putative toxin-antitoxin system toxin component, PIN family [Dyadobacter fanqingshengii]MCF2504381.1 putative toxin-antitoxin system toxin component, PIN family [Dyadobacter fanqingshengii]
MKNKFVFDTNTLISAALSPHSTNAAAIKRAFDLGIIVYSDSTWSEFLNVLFRTKFDKYFTIAEREELADKFLSLFLYEVVDVVVSDCRDPKDNMFLELAVVSKASCIISGDPDLLVLHPFRGIPIINAASFLQGF